MRTIDEILNDFQPITLKEMDSVTLMNRSDTKFVFRFACFPEILEQLKNDFYILEVSGNRKSLYKTLYFDTDDFTLYNHHLHGKKNRDKIRFRTYVSTDHRFFEIKNKNNKNRTSKNRIRWNEEEFAIQGNAEIFLEKHTNIKGETLVPKLWVNYCRITLVNKNMSERLTIDLNLEYLIEDRQKYLSDIVIAELKQEKHSNSLFSQLMHREHIRQASFSKYCMGVGFLYPDIKFNRFKPHLLTLNKIRHGTN